jgi:N-acetylmuramoyl-L-alanine amidase
MGQFYYGNINTKYIVCGDDGHGLETSGKRSPSGTRENEFNHAAKMYMFEALKRCKIGCFDVSPTRGDNSLSSRYKEANKLIKTSQDKKRIIYTSFHFDAYDGKWDTNKGGHTTYAYSPNSEGAKLAKYIHKYMIQGTEQIDRGIKYANYAVLRETMMPAVLTEDGFMDVRWEAELMTNKDFQKECGEERAKGICEYFGVKWIEETTRASNTPLWKVQVGAYANEENAKKCLAQLQKEGHTGYIIKYN